MTDALPVIILPGSPGRTFIETGLVAIQTSRERLFTDRPNKTESDALNSIALHHEWIHFLQSITCSSVHYLSQVMVARSREIVAAAAHGTIPEDAVRALREAEASLYGVGTDTPVHTHDVEGGTIITIAPDHERIGTLDVMEGVAVLESFRLCTLNAGPAHYLKFQEQHFAGERNRVYRRSFNYLANAIGNDAAFELLPLVSFVALQGEDVARSFVGLCKRLSDLARRKGLKLDELANYATFLEALDLQDHEALPHAFKHGEPDSGHFILDKSAVVAVRKLGLDQLLQLAAVPHRMTVESFQAVRPPLTVYSAEDRTILEMNTDLDPEIQQNVIGATSMVGAALRLINAHQAAPYQFCPHLRQCPHAESALCHRQFAPPRASRSHELCGFPKLLKNECGLDPSELWAVTGHAFKTPRELVEAFEATGEAGLLALCHKQRASLTKWLGEDGYGELEWQCDATLKKARNALTTRKMKDLVEARAFRDAVVNVLRRRAEQGSAGARTS